MTNLIDSLRKDQLNTLLNKTERLAAATEIENLRKALTKSIEAIETASVILHELEAQGVELSDAQDEQWLAVTLLNEEARDVLSG